jgi:hypothetical protein
MTKTIENLFLYLSVSSDILIIFLFLLNYKTVKKEKGINVILIYCASSIILNYVGEELLSIKYKYIFYTSYTLVEYLMFTSFLWIGIKSKNLKKIISLLSITFIVFIGTYLIIARHQKIDSISIGIETILILVYSFYYLYEQMNNTDNLFIYNKYEFWVIIGFLIYLAGSFFIYIYANQLDPKFIYNYWFLTNIFYIIKNVLFAIGIHTYVKNDRKNMSIKISALI